MNPFVALLAATAAALPADESFVASHVEVFWSSRYALRDLGGAPGKELVEIGPLGVGVYEFDADGALGETAAHRMPWPSSDLAWDLTDVDGDGRFEVLTLVDGTALHLHEWDDGELADRGALLTAAGVYLPPGVRHVRMARDVDDDGVADIVLPAIDRYLIHVATAPRTWGGPLGVRFDPEIGIDLGDPSSLDDEFGQSVRIPWFTLRDVDGDGTDDLVSRTEDDVTFYIADGTLPASPTWVLDLSSMRDGRSVRERLDLDNLFGLIGDQVKWRVADVDGRGPLDLLLQQGGTVRLFLDGSRGPDLAAPDQVLKASGNVLHTLVRDVDGDGAGDLQLVRTDDLAAARVLRWLVFGGDLDFDVFTYRNEGGSFARRPSHRSTLRLEIPAILTSLDDFEGMEDRVDARSETPAKPICLDGDGRLDDVIDVREGAVVVFRDVIDGDLSRFADDRSEIRGVDDLEAVVEDLLLEDLDALEDGGVKTVDLLEADTLVTSISWELRQLTLGRVPDLTIPLVADDGAPTDDLYLRVDDVDGDGRSDILVTGEDDDGENRITLLINRSGR